jgi:hypothetical protein
MAPARGSGASAEIPSDVHQASEIASAASRTAATRWIVRLVALRSECSFRLLAPSGTGSTPTLILAVFAPGGVPAIRLSRRASQKGAGMPKIVITHAVVDIERWLKGKAERAAVVGAYATNVTDHVAMDGSNNIAVTADVHDMAGAQAMMTSPSPEDAAAMERHGVIPPLTVYVEK